MVGLVLMAIDLGRHGVFIWSSYGIVLIVLGGLVVWLVVDGRTQRRKLAEFEARGVRRRSKPDAQTGPSDDA